MKKTPKAQDLSAAFDWGRGIGEVYRMNRDPMGSAKGTGLRGELRAEFERGLKMGYHSPRAEKEAPPLGRHRKRAPGRLEYV